MTVLSFGCLSFLLIIIGLHSRLHFVFAEKDDKLTLKIDCGYIRGGIGQSVGSGTQYYYFRGIPYAEPPLGNLRFEPPVPIKKWNGTLDTTRDSDGCVQGSNPVEGSEDCLYINVYTPQEPTKGSVSLAVMVYIYGGGFINGDSKYSSFGPDYFLGDGVVVVTFNYRLGIFGFLSTGDLIAPGNAGLKDQVLALQWVKRNIASFGGDPNRVTLFGESAGAISVVFHLQSEMSKGLFHSAIAQSGSSLIQIVYSRRGRDAAFVVGQRLKVSTSSSNILVSALKKTSFRDLQTASYEKELYSDFESNPRRDGFIFGPVSETEHEGAFFSGKSYEMLSKGEFHRIPSIMGLNSMEVTVDLLSSYAPASSINNTGFAEPNMNINNATIRDLVGRQIKKHYFGTTGPVDIESPELTQFFSDDVINRPIRKTVELCSKYAPVYFYVFTYEGKLGGVKDRKVPGVLHAEELNYLWVSDNSATTRDKLVRRRMVKLWTNFAKFGRPTVGNDGLFDNVTWPVASNNKNSNDLYYMDIGARLTVKKNPFQKNLAFWESLYNKYGRPPYDTY